MGFTFTANFLQGQAFTPMNTVTSAAHLTLTSIDHGKGATINRKSSTTHDIISEADLMRAAVRQAAREEEDSTYMGSADVASLCLRGSGSPDMAAQHVISYQDTPVDEEEDTYLDGFSVPTLRVSQSNRVQTKKLPSLTTDSSPPTLPTGPPPTHPVEKHSVPIIKQMNNLYVDHSQDHRTDPPISTDSDDNLYIDHHNLATDEDLYAAPPTS